MQDSGDGSQNLVIVSGVSFELDINRVEIKTVLNSVCSGAAHSVIQHRFSLNLIDVREFERNNEAKSNFLIFQGINSKYDNFPISLIPILWEFFSESGNAVVLILVWRQFSLSGVCHDASVDQSQSIRIPQCEFLRPRLGGSVFRYMCVGSCEDSLRASHQFWFEKVNGTVGADWCLSQYES